MKKIKLPLRIIINVLLFLAIEIVYHELTLSPGNNASGLAIFELSGSYIKYELVPIVLYAILVLISKPVNERMLLWVYYTVSLFLPMLFLTYFLAFGLTKFWTLLLIAGIVSIIVLKMVFTTEAKDVTLNES